VSRRDRRDRVGFPRCNASWPYSLRGYDTFIMVGIDDRTDDLRPGIDDRAREGNLAAKWVWTYVSHFKLQHYSSGGFFPYPFIYSIDLDSSILS